MSEQIKKEPNAELLENFKKIEDVYSKTIRDLSYRLKCSADETIELQAEVISQRQLLVDEMSMTSYSINKILPKHKQLKKKRFEYYTLEYQIKKMTGPEKIKLIEADLAYHDQLIELYSNHIEYLKESIKNLDNINYAIKNKIELYNLMGSSD